MEFTRGEQRAARDRAIRLEETRDWDEFSEFDRWLRTKAWIMRLSPTPAEGRARVVLEDLNPDTDLIPQAVIGRYIVDFLFPAYKLILEIDGSVHRHEWRAEKDAERTAWLEAAGYKVDRVTNEEVEAHWREFYPNEAVA